jgi:hypothetical protein
MELLASEGSDEAADPDPATVAAAPAGPGHAGAEPGCGRPLYVPVRIGSAGGTQVRFARTPAGTRTAVAFTSRRLLAAAFGDQQAWVLLSEPALRSLAEPLGAPLVTVDPRRTVAPRVAAVMAGPGSAALPACARRTDLVPAREMPAGAARTLSAVAPA